MPHISLVCLFRNTIRKSCKSSNFQVQKDQCQWKTLKKCEGDTIFRVLSHICSVFTTHIPGEPRGHPSSNGDIPYRKQLSQEISHMKKTLKLIRYPPQSAALDPPLPVSYWIYSKLLISGSYGNYCNSSFSLSTILSFSLLLAISNAILL